MQRRLIPLVLALVTAVLLWQRGPDGPDTGPGPGPGPAPTSLASETRGPGAAGLPAEAVATLALIRRGGPFPYRQDGREFMNREGRLPDAPPGHYREYTVPTPGSPDRGARRIVTGGDPPAEWYYTDDHYRSFRPVRPGP
jgi:ribonuclease T1